jgi:hypothetical protein
MVTVRPRFGSAESLKVSAAIVTGEVLYYPIGTIQACPGHQSLVRGRTRCLLNKSDAVAAELHRNYIPAAHNGDRTSQNCWTWRQGWVAEKRSRCEPQALHVKCSVTPYGRVIRALAQSDPCGPVVVGFPTRVSQSLQSGIRVSGCAGAKSAETTNDTLRLSLQFVASLQRKCGA